MWTSPEGHICQICHQGIADFENEDDDVKCLVPVVEIDGVQVVLLSRGKSSIVCSLVFSSTVLLCTASVCFFPSVP